MSEGGRGSFSHVNSPTGVHVSSTPFLKKKKIFNSADISIAIFIIITHCNSQ